MPGAAGRSGGDRRSSGEDEFPDDGLPQMPREFSGNLAILWNQLLDQIPANLLRGVDAHQLRILCVTIDQEAQLEKQMQDDPLDLHAKRCFLQMAQHVSRLSAQFGLSPVDRQRLDFSEPVEDDATEWANND